MVIKKKKKHFFYKNKIENLDNAQHWLYSAKFEHGSVNIDYNCL